MIIPNYFQIISSMGFVSIWFGRPGVLGVELALITPSMGISLFPIRGLVPRVPLSRIFAGVLPFYIALFAMPSIATILPELAAGR